MPLPYSESKSPLRGLRMSGSVAVNTRPTPSEDSANAVGVDVTP